MMIRLNTIPFQGLPEINFPVGASVDQRPFASRQVKVPDHVIQKERFGTGVCWCLEGRFFPIGTVYVNCDDWHDSLQLPYSSKGLVLVWLDVGCVPAET
jgi:hypothetical protein